MKLSVCSPRKLSNIEESDVYQMLQRNEDEDEPHEPRQSGSFKALQSFINSEGMTCKHCTNRRRDTKTKEIAQYLIGIMQHTLRCALHTEKKMV